MALNKNPHKGHRSRMIDRVLEHGTHHLQQHEMLEMILYKCYESKNTNEIAHNLLDKFDNSIYKVCNASIKELTSVPGVGEATAKYLKLFPYFDDAYRRSRFKKSYCYKCIDDIGEYCETLFAKDTVESFYILCFDANNRLVKTVKLAEGSATSVDVEHRTVLAAILNTAAVKVAFCHNHPGGTPKLSTEDVGLTQFYKFLLENVNIEVICHILIANGKCVPHHSLSI